jgi:5-methylthioribose kinase
MVPLPGGVSSDIRVVQAPDGELVVKTALDRLKVAVEWRADPARSATEVEAIRAAAELIGPDAVPQIVWVRPEQHSFAMRHVDRRLRNWKQDLLAGRIDPATARAAGTLLARLHRRSMARPDLAGRFADVTYFRALRIVPFFNRVAERCPDLARALDAVVRGMSGRAVALVHGDYSPKNIMADGADLVILDFEVAHWGDPRFDVAFCLSHLLLKAHRRDADRTALVRAAGGFLEAYAAEDGPAPDDPNLVSLLGCLMMARLEGVSPVDYLGDLDVPRTRALARSMMLDPQPSAHQWLTSVP